MPGLRPSIYTSRRTPPSEAVKKFSQQFVNNREVFLFVARVIRPARFTLADLLIIHQDRAKELLEQVRTYDLATRTGLMTRATDLIFSHAPHARGYFTARPFGPNRQSERPNIQNYDGIGEGRRPGTNQVSSVEGESGSVVFREPALNGTGRRKAWRLEE